MKNIMFRLPTIIGLGPHGFYNKDGVPTKSGLQIFIDNAIEGRDIEIFGDPETLKDWFYVKDLAIAIRQSIESDTAKGFFNIGYGHNFTLIEIVQAIVDVFSPKEHKSQIILRRDLANNGFFPPLDISQIAENIGFIICSLDYSPIKGPEGNIEYLLHLSKDSGRTVAEVDVESVVNDSHAELA